MVKVIGAGLAGCEAAYYLAEQGIQVKLYEMRPVVMTEVHKTDSFAELVCSNSLRSNDPYNAVGLLKEEMQTFQSLIIQAAYHAQVPAGSSLAVDRQMFSEYIEAKIKSHPNIEVIKEEVKQLDEDTYTVVAAGPLASMALSLEIQTKLEGDSLHFFDAIAPIIDRDSIDMSICYFKSRYDKGTADYINCPMDETTYNQFYEALIKAEEVHVKDFENNVFEGCMPVEVMAKRGKNTLLFGPLKPVGLEKENEKRTHAVVQLRQDDAAKTMFNIVGFQTHLTWPEQKRIIQMIPGLERANILRYGVMHRNTYLESPKCLNVHYQSIQYPKWFFVGQMVGVEGYVESAASGLNAAIQLSQLIKYHKMMPLPNTTMIGAMASYISTPNQSFVPMNANFGLLPELEIKHKKKERKQIYHDRAMEAIKAFKEAIDERH